MKVSILIKWLACFLFVLIISHTHSSSSLATIPRFRSNTHAYLSPGIGLILARIFQLGDVHQLDLSAPVDDRISGNPAHFGSTVGIAYIAMEASLEEVDDVGVGGSAASDEGVGSPAKNGAEFAEDLKFKELLLLLLRQLLICLIG